MERRTAFGLAIDSRLELPGLRPATPGAVPAARGLVRLEPATRADVERRWRPHGAELLWATTMDGGCPVALERAREGGHRLGYGERAMFWLSPDGGLLLCAPADPAAAAWKRFLLDTALVVTSLLHGLESLHGSAVDTDRGVVAFLGLSGGGKTSLAAELLRRGHPLFCDDILAIERHDDRVYAHPGPALMNLPVDAPWAAPAELGEVLARFGDEAWLEAAGAASLPGPLTAVCLVDRRAGAADGVAPLPASPLPLVPYALAAGAGAERSRQRFELLADLAGRVPLHTLSADPATHPSVLADMVQDALEIRPRDPLGVAA